MIKRYTQFVNENLTDSEKNLYRKLGNCQAALGFLEGTLKGIAMQTKDEWVKDKIESAIEEIKTNPNYITESTMIKTNLKTLDTLKFNLGNLIQRYIYMTQSTLDLDKMDREIIEDKLESLKLDIDRRLEELKANIWMEKEHYAGWSSEFSEPDPVPGAYAVMTKELSDRLTGRHTRIIDGYLFHYDSTEKLKDLKEKYPVGGAYKDEEITHTATFKESAVMNAQNESKVATDENPLGYYLTSNALMPDELFEHLNRMGIKYEEDTYRGLINVYVENMEQAKEVRKLVLDHTIYDASDIDESDMPYMTPDEIGEVLEIKMV